MNFTHLKARLSKYDNDKIAFVGLGNESRGDDAAGLLFITVLKSKKIFNESKFIFAGKNPENHFREILNYNPEVVVFIDAADWGGKSGEISFLDSNSISNTDFSTHTFSIKLVEQYLLINKQMDFVYIGIQPRATELGGEISSQVSQAIKDFFIRNKKFL